MHPRVMYADTSVDEPVKGMSNYHRPRTGFVKRREKGYSGKKKRVCPEQLVDYNPGMAGTDSYGRRRARFSVQRMGKKWWRCLFYWTVDSALCNGYVVYCYFVEVCGGKALLYSDYISAVYHEGFKRLGYDLDAASSSRGGKHVQMDEGEFDSDEFEDVAPRFLHKRCSGVDPYKVKDVSKYDTSHVV